MKTQCSRLLQELRRRPLTKVQAMSCGLGINVGGRVYDLRQAGHDIRTDMVEVKTRYGSAKVARYSLIKERKK